MIITRLIIDGFGRLVDQRFTFAAGLNLIHGPNESGKSTLQACIAALLYGLKRDDLKVAKFEEEYDRFIPWNSGGQSGTRYSARMEYALQQGGDIEVFRRFTKEAEVCIITDLRSGRDVTASFPRARNREVLFALAQFGVSKAIFRSTAFITQQSLRQVGDAGSGTQLLGELAKVNGAGGTASAELQRALLRLKASLEAIGTEQKRVTGYGAALKRRDALQREFDDVTQRRAALAGDQIERSRARSSLDQTRAAAESARHELARAQAFLAHQRFTRAEAFQTHCDSLKTQIDELVHFDEFPAHLHPAFLRHQQLLQHLIQRRDDIRGKLRQADAALAEFTDAGKAFPGFNDLPSDAAQQLAALQAHWEGLEHRATQLGAEMEQKRLRAHELEKLHAEAAKSIEPLDATDIATAHDRLAKLHEAISENLEAGGERGGVGEQIEAWSTRLAHIEAQRSLHEQRLDSLRSQRRDIEERLTTLKGELEPLSRFEDREATFSIQLANAAERCRSAQDAFQDHAARLAKTHEQLEECQRAFAQAVERFGETSPASIRTSVQAAADQSPEDGELRHSLLQQIARREWEQQKATRRQTLWRFLCVGAATLTLGSLLGVVLSSKHNQVGVALAALFGLSALWAFNAWRRSSYEAWRAAAELSELRQPFAEERLRKTEAKRQLDAWVARLNLAEETDIEPELAAWEALARQTEDLELSEREESERAEALLQARQQVEEILAELLHLPTHAVFPAEWPDLVAEEQEAFSRWQHLTAEHERQRQRIDAALHDEEEIQGAVDQLEADRRQVMRAMAPALALLPEPPAPDSTASEQLETLRRAISQASREAQTEEQTRERLQGDVEMRRHNLDAARAELSRIESQLRSTLASQQESLAQLATLAQPVDYAVTPRNVTEVAADLARRLVQFAELRQRHRDALTDGNRLRDDLSAVSVQLHESEATLGKSLEEANVASAEQFLAHYEGAERLNQAREQLRQHEAMLVECLGNEEMEALRSRASASKLEDLRVASEFTEADAQSFEREGRKFDMEAAAMESELSRLEERIRLALQGCRELAEVEEDLQQARLEVEQLRFERQALELARDTIERAAEEFHGRIGPELRATVGDLVRRSTSGRYDELLVDDDFRIQVRAPERGAFVRSDWLSSGTADLLPLLLRLALVEVFARGKEPLPIFLDEALVNLDSKRFDAVLDLLLDTAKRHQVFYFTCHPHHADRLEKHAGMVARLDAPANR